MKGLNRMYNTPKTYPCPYYMNSPMYNPDTMHNVCKMYPCPYCNHTPMYNLDYYNQYIPFEAEVAYSQDSEASQTKKDKCPVPLKDCGPQPFVINLEDASKQNNNFRTALWTGKHLQVTVMSIGVGEDIGLEVHPHGDQFIRIEDGEGIVKMGDSKCKLNYEKRVYDDDAIMIPAGKWHNVINTGNKPMKVYVIYAPPEHPRGTVHKTKAMAEAAEKKHDY